MSFRVIERKSGASWVRILKLHVPSGVPGGTEMVPEHTVGVVEPATGASGTAAVGSGACGLTTNSPEGQASAIREIPVTEMVLPRVHGGNRKAEIDSVRTWSAPAAGV